jgi:hypothetical protein
METFRLGLVEMLGPDLISIYLYGALVFPDSAGTIVDIDHHVLVARPFTAEDRERFTALRAALTEGFPALAPEMDGYVVWEVDARLPNPPRHQLYPTSSVPFDASWALHCAHIHAGRFLTMYGPDPRTIVPVPTPEALRLALAGELRFVEAHLNDAPAYGVLQVCRILYSLETGDVVVSKRAAGFWAQEHIDASWAPLIGAALRHYEGTASSEDNEAVRAGVTSFLDWMHARLIDGLTWSATSE